MLTFVTRRHCPLCDAGLARLRPVSRLLGVGIELRDVDAEPGLARFDERVPVVLDAGERVLAEGRLGWGDVISAAWRARRS